MRRVVFNVQNAERIVELYFSCDLPVYTTYQVLCYDVHLG